MNEWIVRRDRLAEIDRDMKKMIDEVGVIFDQLENVTYQSQRDSVWNALYGALEAVSATSTLCQMVIDYPQMLKAREKADA